MLRNVMPRPQLQAAVPGIRQTPAMKIALSKF